MAEQRQPNYSGKCRNLDPAEAARRRAAGEPAAIRLQIPEHPIRFHDIVRGDVEFSNEVVSDPIVVRSSGMPTYNYVVVIDDADMKITHVIRGDDHISNTPKQVAVYEALGLPVPEFAHLSTILGPDRERLSKRHGATSVANFREMGILPEALMNYLALLGWAPSGGDRELFPKEELIKEFSLERVTPSPAIFDTEKLHWLNRHYIKQVIKDKFGFDAYEALAKGELIEMIAGLGPNQKESLFETAEGLGKNQSERAAAFAGMLVLRLFYKKGWIDKNLSPEQGLKWVIDVMGLLAPYVNSLDEIPERALIFFQYDAKAALNSLDNAEVLSAPTTPAVLLAFGKQAANESPLTPERFKAIMDEIKAETGAKGKDLFHPVRIMLIGSHSGPDFNKLIPLIEDGSRLELPVHVKSVRERINEFLAAMEQHPLLRG
jgi:glutamyl/glutaminyl-tRNA synthetase